MVNRSGQQVLTNAEGFEIPGRSKSPRRDRYVYILLGVLQLVAVAIIAKQLKDLGVLPEWVNTDFSTARPYTFLPPAPSESVTSSSPVTNRVGIRVCSSALRAEFAVSAVNSAVFQVHTEEPAVFRTVWSLSQSKCPSSVREHCFPR